MAKDDKAKQVQALADQIAALQTDSSDNSNAEKKGVSWTKLCINGSYVVLTVLGIYASMTGSLLDIDKYIKFLENFSIYWAPLVVSYAGGTSFKKYTEAKKEIEGSGNSTDCTS